MAEVTKPKSDIQKAIEAVDEGNKQINALQNKVAELEKKLSEPNRAPFVTSGPIGRDSEPYSILKAAAFCMGELGREQVKTELDIHERLKTFFGKHGWAPTKYGNNTFLMPHNSMAIPDNINGDDSGRKLRIEVRQKMTAMEGGFDPDEYDWLRRKSMGLITKTPMGTISDTAGGVLVGFPTLGELIDLQRNLEVFPNAGSTEVGLPPNGRAQFPKLTGGATAYWVGEAQPITESAETTGYLDLQAKKLGILVKLNNELIRYASPTAEGMVRLDMSRVAARKADLGMLSGTGGTQIKGLITYPTQTDWTYGNDSLITPSALTGGSTLLTGPDIALIENLLPDTVVGDATAWVMRRALWSKIRNFRADAITTGDAAGPFLFSMFRGLDEGFKDTLSGTKVVRSSQVSKTRSGGNETGGTATYLLYGYFPDWIIARFGVMEFLATTLGDTAFTQDQTWLRGIQLLDAGPRHAASFVFVDGLTNTTT